MQIIRSKYAGACYGVQRALRLVDQAAAKSLQGVHTLGPLIHNPQVVSELHRRGIKEAQSVEDVRSGVIVIRSHGVAPAIIERAHSLGLQVEDATCPHVSKAHQAARELLEQGYRVLVVGEKGHPEVEGISAYAGEDAIVAQEPSDLPAQLHSDKIGIVVQTTQSASTLEAIVRALRARGIKPKVCNTICFATRQRQEAAKDLAAKVDVMLVVGGRNSGNTTRLAQLCSIGCAKTYHIETCAELEAGWFDAVDSVGITAGASTPEDQITAVEQALVEMTSVK